MCPQTGKSKFLAMATHDHLAFIHSELSSQASAHSVSFGELCELYGGLFCLAEVGLKGGGGSCWLSSSVSVCLLSVVTVFANGSHTIFFFLRWIKNEVAGSHGMSCAGFCWAVSTVVSPCPLNQAESTSDSFRCLSWGSRETKTEPHCSH